MFLSRQSRPARLKSLPRSCPLESLEESGFIFSKVCARLRLDVARRLNDKSAWQSRFPGDQFPSFVVRTELPALDEGGIHLDLGRRQVLPSIPGGVPVDMQERRVQPKLELAVNIATQGPVLIEITLSQRQLEAAVLSLW